MRKIGFLGGTFDPIHIGHINLAIELSEAHHLSEVLFCPSFCSPFKTAFPPKANPLHRAAMVRAAIQDIPSFRYISLEIEKSGVSYTIDTLRRLKEDLGKTAEALSASLRRRSCGVPLMERCRTARADRIASHRIQIRSAARHSRLECEGYIGKRTYQNPNHRSFQHRASGSPQKKTLLRTSDSIEGIGIY